MSAPEASGARALLVIASSNLGKVAEMRRLLASLHLEVRGLDDFPDLPEIDEPADSFEGNASHKAISISELTGLPALADDSGLQVDALDGRPGVLSSRYAPTDSERVIRLLDELKSVPDGQRGANFVCAMALAYEGQVRGMWKGVCSGSITRKPQGNEGFGYDPIFFCPETGRTFAEMSAAEKNRVSHRGRALNAAIADLPDILADIFNT